MSHVNSAGRRSHTHERTEKLCWYTKHSSDEEGRKLPGKVERMINGCVIKGRKGKCRNVM